MFAPRQRCHRPAHRAAHPPSSAARAAPSRSRAAAGNQEMQHRLARSATGSGRQIGGRQDRAESDAEAAAARVSSSLGTDAGPRRVIRPQSAASLFRSAGQPIEAAARSRLDAHFAGLDQVRVHAGPEAAVAADALQAHAFAVGSDIAFAAGRYAPGTLGGIRLLAHELAHAAQGGDVIRRQPAEESDDEEGAQPPMSRSLFSLDYSSPQVCGGQPCFTDDMIEQAARGGVAEQEQMGAIVAHIADPVGEVGQFAVSVGPLLEEPRTTEPAAAAGAIAGTASLPMRPLADQRIVLGGNDRIAANAAVSMSKQTTQPIVGLRPGSLAGAQEISLVAHANEDVVRIGNTRLPPKDLAARLVQAGWRGRIVRLVACDTGVVAGPPTYAQRLANELARLGVESAVIAPKGAAVFPQGRGLLPRVLPPGATPIPANARALGKGWVYAVPEVPLGPAPPAVERPLPFRHPSTWTGAGWMTGKMAAAMALSYVHGKAVAERVEEERQETGFADWGPTGNRLYDLGAWFLDPTDEVGRSIPLSQRFDMPTWRRNLATRLLKHPVGEKLRMSWTTSGDPDPTWGNPTYRQFIGIYVKRPDGTWSTWGCKDCESGDFPPDLNRILDPFVSDAELWDYLELPTSTDTGGLA
jgi:hypothetical protein